MLYGRHIDQKATGKSDVRRDAGTLFGDRLLRDLDQYLLSFAQQIRNRGLLAIPATRSSLAATPIATPIARVAIIARITAIACSAIITGRWRRNGGGQRQLVSLLQRCCFNSDFVL